MLDYSFGTKLSVVPIRGLPRDALGGLRTDQPLRPPAVRPAMMLRWKMKKIAIAGTLAITSAAMSTFCGNSWESWEMATLTGILLVSGITSSGQTKSFHTLTTAKMDTTPRIGRDTGRMIDHS